MTTPTSAANATGLPDAIHAFDPMPRRGFLASLAALPFVGGSIALLDQSDNGVEPTGLSGPDQSATIDYYAAATFEALEVNLDDVRSAHQNMWTPLAVSLTLMSKCPDECRDVAAHMGDHPTEVEGLITSLKNGAAWFRQAAELIESAECRYLCGAARFAKEQSESGGLDA